MKQDQMLVVLFLACCFAAIGWVCQNGNWDAVLFDGQSYFEIALPDGPVWSLPNTPDYIEFRRVFDHLPAVPSQSPQIKAVICWMFMIEKIIGLIWIISLVFGLASLIGADLRSNVVLLFVRRFAYTLTIAFAMSIISWIVFGGWGPPSPLPFALFGIIGGIIWRWIMFQQGRHN